MDAGGRVPTFTRLPPRCHPIPTRTVPTLINRRPRVTVGNEVTEAHHMTLRRHHPATDPRDDRTRYAAYVASDGSVVVFDEREPDAWIQSDAAVAPAAMA